MLASHDFVHVGSRHDRFDVGEGSRAKQFFCGGASRRVGRPREGSTEADALHAAGGEIGDRVAAVGWTHHDVHWFAHGLAHRPDVLERSEVWREQQVRAGVLVCLQSFDGVVQIGAVQPFSQRATNWKGKSRLCAASAAAATRSTARLKS